MPLVPRRKLAKRPAKRTEHVIHVALHATAGSGRDQVLREAETIRRALIAKVDGRMDVEVEIHWPDQGSSAR